MNIRTDRTCILGVLTFALVATAAEARAQAATDIAITRSAAGESQLGSRENFTGVARIYPLYAGAAAGGARPSGGVVAFEAGARTAWHIHPRGQTLIVTAGVGRVQRWEGAAQEIRPGDVVWIPPGVKHWHGAGPTTGMTHVALAEAEGGRAVQWLEDVSDAQYASRVESGGLASAPAPASERASLERLRQTYGEFAPKMVDVTQNVLFADIWARPQLARRARSLVTVTALASLNRPDQLRSHITLARENGVTQEEMVEALTHLAFYAGWPAALGALGIARDVYQPQR